MSGARGDTTEHIRSLLGQRHNAGDVPSPHTRYSIFSDRSDSPSLYSHFDNNIYRTNPTTPVPRFPRFHDNDTYDDRHDIYPPLSPKERLQDPNASSLDLSEDTDAYFESASRIADQEEESNLNPEEDEDPETRLSLMGPKMRVHSRAPWEEGEDSLSDEEIDDGGNDNGSIFGTKKPGLAVMRGLGFGSRSPAPRPSFDYSFPNKDKRSFDTASSVAASGSSRSAVLALAQASMSSTSLAVVPVSSTNRLPHKLSVGHLTVSRDRSASGPASASGAISPYSTHPSSHSRVYTERPSVHDSPSIGRRDSISPIRSEFVASMPRTRSPSPIPTADNDGVYTHPYANPALLPVYHREPARTLSNNDAHESDRGRAQLTPSDSVATLAVSEETVMLTHSSSTASASLASTFGLETSTSPTSEFSLGSSTSRVDLSQSEDVIFEQEKSKNQKRSKRETKLGPISAPISVGNNDFAAATPYNLISLEQAQARAKERSRSATTGTAPFAAAIRDEKMQSDLTQRTRSSSATSKAMYAMPLTADSHKTSGEELSLPISPVGPRQLSPGRPLPGKTLRPKRSGFMKLFNSKEKDKTHDMPPPLPPPETRMFSQSADNLHPPVTTCQPKISTYRVPVPAVSLSPQSAENKDDTRLKKSAPTLSIKVSSPPRVNFPGQDVSARRSDSPKSLHPSAMPRMPSSAPADVTQFPVLKLRPVSSFFSKNFADHLLTEETRPESPRHADVSSLISPTTIASSDLIPSPVNAGFSGPGFGESSEETENPSVVIAGLKEQIRTSRKAWQRQIWELEGQIRDLRAEIDDIRTGDVCETCGRGGPVTRERRDINAGVIHRPRAKTGHGARFASGNDN